MFLIGMVATIRLGTGDIAGIILRAGRGIAGLATVGLMIVVLSTVTTTFLDAYSAGISALSISKKIPSKLFAVVVTVIGTLGAIFLPMENITDFLYLIGSVFAPMIAVMLADYYILKEDSGEKKISWLSFICWLIGFALYRWLLHVDTPLGSTLPDMALTMVITIVVKKILGSASGKAHRT